MRTKEIHVTKPSMPSHMGFARKTGRLWRSRRLTSFGPGTRELEQEIGGKWVGLKGPEIPSRVCLTSSGDMALYLTIQTLLGQNYFPGDRSPWKNNEPPEIITTPFTFLSTAEAILRCGFRPVFADIDPVTMCLDPEEVRRHITARTVGILPVHVFGNLCDVRRIRTLADQYGLKVIYDAAHAFGETVHMGAHGEERSVLTLGDASCCSLNATKVFQCAEGGIVVFHDAACGERFRRLSNFGLSGRDGEDAAQVGCNGKQDELRALLGLGCLDRLPESILRRKRILWRYEERLRGVPGITSCFAMMEERRESSANEDTDLDGTAIGKWPGRPGVDAASEWVGRHDWISWERNGSYFPILVGRNGPPREYLCRTLNEEGIYPRKYFYPLVSGMTAFRKLLSCCPEETPIAHDISQRILCLPIYEGMSMKDVDRVCRCIRKAVGG